MVRTELAGSYLLRQVKNYFRSFEKTPAPDYRAAMVTSLEDAGWIVTRVSDPITQ